MYLNSILKYMCLKVFKILSKYMLYFLYFKSKIQNTWPNRRPRVQQQYQHNMHRVCKVTKLDKSYLEVLSTVVYSRKLLLAFNSSNFSKCSSASLLRRGVVIQAYTAKHYSLLSILWKYFRYTKKENTKNMTNYFKIHFKILCYDSI